MQAVTFVTFAFGTLSLQPSQAEIHAQKGWKFPTFTRGSLLVQY